MRNMSFAMTVDALLTGEKTVTRRVGWSFLKPGDRISAVRKAMGLRKGEKVERLAVIEVTGVRTERLDAITNGDVRREGLRCSREAFLLRFCKAMRCKPSDQVTRIEFRKVSA